MAISSYDSYKIRESMNAFVSTVKNNPKLLSGEHANMWRDIYTTFDGSIGKYCGVISRRFMNSVTHGHQSIELAKLVTKMEEMTKGALNEVKKNTVSDKDKVQKLKNAVCNGIKLFIDADASVNYQQTFDVPFQDYIKRIRDLKV